MTLPTLEEWFEIVCNDLDPERKYERPELCREWMWPGVGGSYDPPSNTVRVSIMTDNELHIVAHELRHWQQIQSGRLSNVWIEPIAFAYRVSGTWDGDSSCRIAATTESYFAIPWEADAEAYAAEVCARLLPTAGVA